MSISYSVVKERHTISMLAASYHSCMVCQVLFNSLIISICYTPTKSMGEIDPHSARVSSFTS